MIPNQKQRTAMTRVAKRAGEITFGLLHRDPELQAAPGLEIEDAVTYLVRAMLETWTLGKPEPTQTLKPTTLPPLADGKTR